MLSLKTALGAREERPLARVPPLVRALLVAALLAQVAWSCARPPPPATAAALPPAPPEPLLRLLSLGESAALARTLMLWLQSFDNQRGLNIPFARLDYDRVADWLSAVLALDEGFQYPLLSAARLYAAVPDRARTRQMLRFIHQRFLDDPAGRWPWMLHGVHIARHRLQDPQLAARYAAALRLARGAAPPWATRLPPYAAVHPGAPPDMGNRSRVGAAAPAQVPAAGMR